LGARNLFLYRIHSLALTFLVGLSAIPLRAGQAAVAPSVTLDGLVQHKLTFTLSELKAMAPQKVEASFGTMHGPEHHVWVGVKLLDLIDRAGLKPDEGKFPELRHSVIVHGQDGYEVAVAIGEMDPKAEDKRVILAYKQEGDSTDLPGLRLVVPGDAHGARQIHDVTEVEVK
jgi:DMSO/TMAO reductase YedYZ molybdopterin-dependent catalytic subunit